MYGTFYSVTQKKEIALFAGAYVTEHYVERSKPDSEKQVSFALSPM